MSLSCCVRNVNGNIAFVTVAAITVEGSIEFAIISGIRHVYLRIYMRGLRRVNMFYLGLVIIGKSGTRTRDDFKMIGICRSK